MFLPLVYFRRKSWYSTKTPRWCGHFPKGGKTIMQDKKLAQARRRFSGHFFLALVASIIGGPLVIPPSRGRREDLFRTDMGLGVEVKGGRKNRVMVEDDQLSYYRTHWLHDARHHHLLYAICEYEGRGLDRLLKTPGREWKGLLEDFLVENTLTISLLPPDVLVALRWASGVRRKIAHELKLEVGSAILQPAYADLGNFYKTVGSSLLGLDHTTHMPCQVDATGLSFRGKRLTKLESLQMLLPVSQAPALMREITRRIRVARERGLEEHLDKAQHPLFCQGGFSV
jgi:hypothetical protein